MRRTLFILLLYYCSLAGAQERQHSIPVNAVQTMCTELIQRYPSATLQDVYKTCYQDFFGAEHLMRDTAAAKQYLHSEIAQCLDHDLTAMPLREPTGFRHRFVRISIQNVIHGNMTEEELLNGFIDAARKDNALHADWVSEWEQIERIALEVHPVWKDEDLQRELRHAAQLNAAVRHSDAFRNTYHPHYRIIRNENH